MATRTIQGVKEPRPWNKDGQLKGHFINGVFDDGQEFSVLVMGQIQAADAVVAQLRELIGKPSEFQGEERTSPNGTKQLNLKQWPGKQGGGGGGGGGFKGREYVPAYSQSKECHEATQRSIQRHSAFQMSIELLKLSGSQVTGNDLVTLASKMADSVFAWLSAPGPAPSTSHAYESWTEWMRKQVDAKVFTDKATAWKAAMTAAHELGFDQNSLKTCNDDNVFSHIREKLKMPTKPAAKYDDPLPF